MNRHSMRSLVRVSALWAWPVSLVVMAAAEGWPTRLFGITNKALSISVLAAMVVATVGELVRPNGVRFREAAFLAGGFYLVGRLASAFDPPRHLPTRSYVILITLASLLLQGHVVAYLLARLTLLEEDARGPHPH